MPGNRPFVGTCAVLLASILILRSAAPAAPPATAQTSSPLGGTPVTVHVKNVTVMNALAAVSKASGLAFDADSNAEDPHFDATVTLDLDAQPLWSALIPICQAANLRPIRFTTDKPGIVFGGRDGAWNAKYTQFQGGYAIGLLRIEQSLDRNYSREYGAAPRMYTVNFCICPEPGLNVQRIAAVKISKCLD